MNSKRLHTIVALLTLAVMTLTSTGFTTVLRYCTMTESSECCCETEAAIQQTWPANGLALTAPDASCLTQTIAGGRNEIDATIHAGEIHTLQAADLVSFGADAVCDALPFRTHSIRSIEDAAPPGIDIYIRVNSFLI